MSDTVCVDCGSTARHVTPGLCNRCSQRRWVNRTRTPIVLAPDDPWQPRMEEPHDLGPAPALTDGAA